MKPTHNILLGLVAASAWLIAGSVTIPHSFTANTTAKASEVNANFSAIKTAVDDNNGRIKNNTDDIRTNITNIQTNASNIAAAVTDVTVGSGLDVNRSGSTIGIKKANGYVAVNGNAFTSSNEYNNTCSLIRGIPVTLGGSVHGGTTFSANSTSNLCQAFASVIIPNNAIIKKLTCRVKHHHTGNLHVQLYELQRSYNSTTHAKEDINATKLIEATLDSGSTKSTTQEISGTYTGASSDNPTYRSYIIVWDPPATNSAGGNEVLYDCKVDYEY